MDPLKWVFAVIIATLIIIVAMMIRSDPAEAATGPKPKCELLVFQASQADGTSTARTSLPPTPYVFFVGTSPAVHQIRWSVKATDKYAEGKFDVPPGNFFRLVDDGTKAGISKVLLSSTGSRLRLRLTPNTPGSLKGLQVCYKDFGSPVVKP